MSFTGAQTAITTFSSSISPIAVDSAGEIFTVESTGTGFRLVRVLPSGQKTVLNSNFPWSPTAIAVNPQGTSLYFIHNGPSWQMPNGGPMNWVYIAKTTISGDVAAPPTDLPCTFGFPGWNTAYSSPTDLKVDTAGNVYIADYGAGLFWKIGAGSTVPTQFLTLASAPGQPWGLALTPDGATVYFTYSDMALNPQIGSVPASFFGTSFTGRTPTLVATGLSTMQSGLVVDGSGVLYVGGTIPSGESVVFRVSGGVLTPVTPPSPSSLYSFGVDGAGKFYTGGVDTAGHPVISTTSFTDVGIGSINIGTPSAVVPLAFEFNTGGTLGSIEVLTEGAANLDFKNVGTGTCNTTTAFVAGAKCTVNVRLIPAHAGVRKGAVVLRNSSGLAIATVYVHGSGVGPQVAFSPVSQSTVVSELGYPYGLTLDGSGNVYIADTYNNQVVKVPWTGGGYGPQSMVGSGLLYPNTVAVDGSGNVYIADTGNGRVVKVPWTGSGYGPQGTVGSGLNSPKGVALDGSGNVYIADAGNGRVVKVPWTGSGYGAQSTLLSGLSGLSCLAVDGSGNIYITDTINNRVVKVPWTGSGYGPQSTVGSGLNYPVSVAVDGSGNVYIADTDNWRVLKVPWTVSGYGPQSTMGGGWWSPRGVAVDGSGNVYGADFGSKRVLKVNVTDAPSLSFDTTEVGAVSPAQDVVVENIGNAPLNISQISTAANFTVQGPNTTCVRSGQALDVGSSCTLSIEFAPVTTGNKTGSVVVTDNTLNQEGATQAIALTGYATPTATVTNVNASPNPQTKGGSVIFTAVVVPSAATGTITFYDNGVQLGQPQTLSGGQATFTVSSLTTGDHTITATYSGDVSYLGSSGTTTATIIPATPVITWATPAPITYGAGLSGTQLNASTTVDGTWSYSPAAGTVLNAASHTLNVTFTPDDNTNYTTATASVTLTVNPASASVTPTAASKIYGTADPTFSGTLTGFLGSDNVTASYSRTAGETVAGGPYAISATLAPSGVLSNYDVTYNTAPFTITKATAPITLGSLSQTYTGSALSATATTTPARLTVSYDYTQGGVSVAPIAAGSYSVTATINDANYQGTATGTLVIGKATATVTLGGLSQTYTGSALAANATTTPAGLAVTFTYDGGATAPTNVGNYAVVATVNDNNYQGTASGTLVITKATATVTLGNLSQTYTGSPLAATATTTPAGLAVSFTYDGAATAPTNAGNYAVVATVNDNNYQGTAGGTLVIDKAAATITLGNLGQTYTGSALSPTAMTNPAGLAVTYSYTQGGVAAAPIGAGSYSVSATINDTNYQGTTTGTLVIGKATAPITLGSLSQIYTGSALSATATTTPPGLTVDYNYTQGGVSAAPIAAGSYSVTGVINDANYEGSATGVLVIGKATATVNLTSLNQTYTGSPLAAIVATVPAGLSVDVTYDGGPTVPTNAGNYAVVVTVNDNNYQGTATGTLIIGKATATITLGSLSQTYTGSALAATAVTSPAGLTVHYNYTQGGASVTPIAAGSYAVTGTIDDANYQGSETGTLVIGKATATVTLGSLSHTYTGSALAATAVTNPVGLTVDFTYNGTSTSPVDATNYSVLGTVNDPNYEGSASGTLVIGKAPLSVTASDASMTYGAVVPTLTGALTGAASSDLITASYTTTATSASSVGPYTITPVLNDPSLRLSNYTVTATDAVLTINPATLTVVSDDASITYNSAIPALTGTLSGVLNNDPITATWTTTATQGSNAGTFPITATLVATPAVLANYTVSNTPGVLTITKAPGSAATVSTSATTSYHGQSLTFTAHVTNSAGTPDGSVAFYDGATLLGNATLASGTAVYSTSALGIGSHSVTAVYAGSTNYVEATSAAVDQVVLAPAVSINGSGTGGLLGSITVTQGSSGTTQFQIGSLGTLTSAISVACSGLPAGLACQVTPSPINVTGLPASVTVTVSTAKYKIIGSNFGDRGMAHLALAMGMLLPGAVLLSRKRRIRFVVLPLLSVVLMLGLSGCGGGTKMTNAAAVTPPGTYTATITATSSGATSITSTINVVVVQ